MPISSIAQTVTDWIWAEQVVLNLHLTAYVTSARTFYSTSLYTCFTWCLSLPSSFYSSLIPTKIWCAFLISFILHNLPNWTLLDVIIRTIQDTKHKVWNSSLCNFFHSSVISSQVQHFLLKHNNYIQNLQAPAQLLLCRLQIQGTDVIFHLQKDDAFQAPSRLLASTGIVLFL